MLVELAQACKEKGEVMLMYTHNIGGGIRELLLEALEEKGMQVAFFTGRSLHWFLFS